MNKYHTPTARHILIVDDARDIRQSLSQYLQTQGMNTSIAADAAEARAILADARIDLVILDIMMPGEDGLSLCRWLAANNDVPVILLTAMAADMDRIIGLEVGADDYVVKPFNPRELLARARAVMRRRPGPAITADNRRRRFGDWTHDPTDHTLTHHNARQVSLTSTENRLLGVFLDHPYQVLNRGMLLERVMQREEKAFDRAIDNQVGRIRKKIEKDPARPRLLVTEWGGGYKLMADVEELETR
ncbi:MAG: response regulator transcription factor [Pseudomonadota bacterium]